LGEPLVVPRRFGIQLFHLGLRLDLLGRRGRRRFRLGRVSGLIVNELLKRGFDIPRSLEAAQEEHQQAGQQRLQFRSCASGAAQRIEANCPLRTVRLNWLDINGAGTAANGVRILDSVPGSSVVIENTNIDGFTSRGISDERTVGGELFVTNTTVRNTAGSGIAIVPSGARLDALIDNVRVLNSLFGTASGNGAKTSIVRSTFAGNSNTVFCGRRRRGPG